MEWGGNRDPPCSADTEPLTTRHPRRDDLTFVEQELSVRLFHFLSPPQFTILYYKMGYAPDTIIPVLFYEQFLSGVLMTGVVSKKKMKNISVAWQCIQQCLFK